MIRNKDTALKVAEFLMQIKAVKLQPNNPFTWASGWKSPIYCDNRKTLSYPQIRNFIRQEFAAMITDKFGEPDLIAGVATGGIPHGVLVAQHLGLPFAYVRSESKGHGLENMIEGEVGNKQSVVVVEDLISTGGSSLRAVQALKDAGCKVKGLVAIFSYGFRVSDEAFKKAKCPYFTLTNYQTLIEQAMASGFIDESQRKDLELWKEHPDTWGK
ncbi:MAG: orotate phosphoribosyltransferase [Bacteroidetes bacterium]|nr:orotate phosphoribosyltransferase [Bacteroidota bacterium]